MYPRVMLVYHEFLVEAPALIEASCKVVRFLDLYELVVYDRVEVVEQRCIRGDAPSFWSRLADGVHENRLILLDFLAQLGKTGLVSLDDLAFVSQGYESKLLHLIAHMVDGFFGVDSYFFNLMEDSHWVSPETAGMLHDRPWDFWLVGVDGATGPEPQGFERKSPGAIRALDKGG